jgi:hypothetical protein
VKFDVKRSIVRTIAAPAYSLAAVAVLALLLGAGFGAVLASKNHNVAGMISAGMTFISTLAIVITAAYAKVQIDEQRDLERLRRTMSVLEAPFTLSAMALLGEVFKEGGESLDGLRTRAKSDPDFLARCEPIVGTYCYIAALYDKGALDFDLLVAKDCVTIIGAYYIFQDVIITQVSRGMIVPAVRRLAKDALARMKERPQAFMAFPSLRDLSFD